MKLYITRHGTTEWNSIGKLQGWLDSNLTDEGIKRAIDLGRRLKDVDFDFIYSSPQKRALDTAKYIRGDKNTQIITSDSLMELGLGEWEGKYFNTLEKDYPELYHTYMNKPEEYFPEKGETFMDLFNRIEDFLKEIRNIDAKNVLIVTHGVTIKALIMMIKGMSIEQFCQMSVYTGTALNICEIADDGFQMLIEGDTSHIDTEPFEEFM